MVGQTPIFQLVGINEKGVPKFRYSDFVVFQRKRFKGEVMPDGEDPENDATLTIVVMCPDAGTIMSAYSSERALKADSMVGEFVILRLN